MHPLKAILAILIISAGGLGQSQPPEPISVGKYDRNGGGSCDENFRITNLLDEIAKNEGSRGLVVVYAGPEPRRFGNLRAYVSGAEVYLANFIKAPKGAITFVIAEGKNLFNEEFWLIPKGASLPPMTPIPSELRRLDSKYHFGYACLQCEPSYPWLTGFQPNFEEFAAILKAHPEYAGLVEVNNREDLVGVTRALTGRIKLARDRYKIRYIKSSSKRESDDLDLSVNLYLLPMERRSTGSLSTK